MTNCLRCLPPIGKVALGNAFRCGLGEALTQPRCAFGIGSGCQNDVHVDSRVPDIQCPRVAIPRDPLAIRTHASQRGIALVGGGESVRPRSEREARREPLDIPFPRARQRLVEIVDVEDLPPFRGGEAAEVHEVAIAAGLHADARVRRAGKVGGHVERRAPIERERRHRHAPAADRDQLGDPPLARRDHQVDRIRSVTRCLPLAVLIARHAIAQRFAGGIAFIPVRTGRRRGQRFVATRIANALGHFLPPRFLPCRRWGHPVIRMARYSPGNNAVNSRPIIHLGTPVSFDGRTTL